MSNKLTQRYNDIETQLSQLRRAGTGQNDEVTQARIAELEAQRINLKKTILHLTALSKMRDEAWRALAY